LFFFEEDRRMKIVAYKQNYFLEVTGRGQIKTSTLYAVLLPQKFRADDHSDVSSNNGNAAGQSM
jgi:hypothetical protein